MAPETSYKPFRRAFAMFAVALLAVCALGGALSLNDDASAASLSTGSKSSPLSSLSAYTDDLNDHYNGTTFYVSVGGTVRIMGIGDAGGFGEFAYFVDSVTSGYGLTLESYNGDDGDSDYDVGLVSGTLTKAGTLTVSGNYFNGKNSGDWSITIVSVSKGTPVTSISISGSSSVNKGSTLTLTATTSPSSATDRHVTWSITSGSSYATIQSTSDTSTGGKCVITGVSAGSVTVKATAADGSGASATKTITVENPSYLYNLKFDANGGDLGNWDGWVQKSASDTTSTLRFTIPSDEPTRSGYTFLGWSKSSSASSATYTAGDTVYVDYNDLTLYAVWQENKQTYYAYLYYNANGGSGAPSTQSDSIYASSASGSKSFTISTTKPTKSGYDFLGWSTSSSASSASYQPGGSISVSYGSSKTLYAVWKQAEYTSTLIFDANGGSGAPSKLTDTHTSTSAHMFTIPSTKPTKSGYIFLGWSDSKTASAASYQPGATISVPYNGTKTLYAVWEQAKITITSNPALTSLKVGQAWSYTPAASVDGCAVSVSGADWLSASNGKVSGTPTKAGTYTVTITLEKDGYESATQTFTLKVYSALGFDSEPSSKGILTYVSG